MTINCIGMLFIVCASQFTSTILKYFLYILGVFINSIGFYYLAINTEKKHH